MKHNLDCRGLHCPAPVLQVREALQNADFTQISVLVDNEAARQNVSRFLTHQNYQVSTQQQGSDFIVSGDRQGRENQPEIWEVPVMPSSRAAKKIMVLVTSAHMGHGDDGLGDMLMFNFLKTLKEIGSELWRVAFVNSGVHFTASGSEAVPLLQELMDNGVHISACGACLAYFHVLDTLQVGEVTNMLEIVSAMKEADSVITV